MTKKFLPIFVALFVAILAILAPQAEASKGPVITNKASLFYPAPHPFELYSDEIGLL